MPFQPGHSKIGGRKKGTVNLRTKLGPNAQEIAESMGFNPFEVLLYVAANNWQALGYDTPCITIAERIVAAAKACEYLYPKIKAVQHVSEDQAPLGFAEMFQRVLEERSVD